jgi:hypothetical protein
MCPTCLTAGERRGTEFIAVGGRRGYWGCVATYGVTGVPLSRFGQDILRYPYDLFVVADGDIGVVDNMDRRCRIFSANGAAEKWNQTGGWSCEAVGRWGKVATVSGALYMLWGDCSGSLTLFSVA